MKTFLLYPGSSPHKRRIGWWITAVWLAFAPLTLVNGTVTINCPPSTNISCSVPPIPANTGTATASTNCPSSSAVTITYTDNAQMTGCMGTGTITRTWKATDQCGASATCIQSIVVEDNTSPTLTCPPFKIISCESDTTPANLGSAVAMDNCTPTNLITISYIDHVENLGQCNGTGSFTRHWTATDMCGNVAACIQTIVVIDNTAPVLNLPPSLTISCEQSTSTAFTGLAEAFDNCTPVNELVINFSDNVLGLSGCSGTGTIVRTWSAKDACFNIVTGTQFITIQDNTPPAITCPGNVTISCEASILPANTGTFSASDLCGSVFTGYTDQVVQQVCNGTGIINRTWTAIDGCGNVSSCIQTITIIDITLPAITCPANITIDCALGVLPAVTGAPVVSDNCTSTANLVVTYTDITLGSLGCNGTGDLQRSWTVADACGNSTTCVQMIHITDLLKPTITCPPPATISCESSVLPAVTGTATAFDNCTPQASVVINYIDDLSGLFGCNHTGVLKRTWTATDLCGNTTSCIQQIWIVDNTLPDITCPANVEISCSDSSAPNATGWATGQDNCSLQVEITYSDLAQLNDCNNTGLILRNWSARDECGNVRTCVQLITVVDNTIPVLTCPRDTILDCGFYINPDVLGYPKGIDNCTPSDELGLDYDDDLSGLTGCTNTGVIIRTWYMTDLCGNTGSCIQRITIADTTKPVINCPPNTVINCTDSTAPNFNGKATATDYCTASLFIKITHTDDLSQAGQCNGSGWIYRTWRAEDQCGNFSTCVQSIQIIDNIAPEIQCPASYQIQCDVDRSPVTQGKARATDNCTPQGDIAITYNDDITNLTGCNGTGNLYRTWKATDACGNTSTCVQVMTIIDTKAPIAIPPVGITISCESSLDPSVTGNVNANDNCTPTSQLNITVSDDLSAVVGCNQTGTIKRTWVVKDACGNSASCTQNIRIVDTTPPTIQCAASLEVNCGDPIDPASLGKPQIQDNCTAADEMDLLNFDNTTGLNGCSGTGTLYRTWIVYDDCGNSNSCVQTIKVVDNIPPAITLPDNITISCEYADDLDALGSATAEDGCTPTSSINITYTDNNLGLVFCNATGERQRVWKATDLCGNYATAIQHITFIDTLAPIFYTPFDATINCDANPTDFNLLGEVEVYTDNCADLDDVTVKWHDDLTNIEDCDSNPVFPRIWTLSDPCGNTRSSIQRITVMNFSMAEVQFPDDVVIPCDADMSDLALTGSITMPEDACSYLIDTMYYEELGQVAPYKFERLWVCIDYCGHIEQDTQVIDLLDKYAPEVVVHDISISFAQNDSVEITVDQVVYAVEDNCDPEIEIALSQPIFTCEDFLISTEQVLEIIATDDQGNQNVQEVSVSLVGGLFLMECPQDIVAYLEPGECYLPLDYPMQPVGLCNQTPTVVQTDGTGLTSGDLFPIGTTHQSYVITDQLGYSLQCAFNVVVNAFQGTNELACQDTLHVSVAEDCQAVVNADMLLEGDHYGCYDNFLIDFTDPGVIYVNGILVAYPHIGDYLHACITDAESGNFCCSVLLIEDKLPPTLTCSDITLNCTDDIAPQNIPHFPVPPGSIVTPLGGKKFSVTGIDNCGPTTISYKDTEEIHMCDGIYARIITRTWIAVDPSNRADTCSETIYLLRGTIDQFVFPGDTTIYCGNNCLRPDGTPDPACLGGIEGPFCGTFFIGYIDKVIPFCGGSYSIKREWSLVDWCSGEVIDTTQIINVEDNVPPVIDCEEVTSAPSGFGDCGATVHLTPPNATDACNSYPLTYTLKLNGHVVLPINGQYTLPPLGIGQFELTWEVRDDCGNLATCHTTLDLYDSTPPTVYCDKHTVISINNQDPMGVALLPATTLDDGSFDNCGPVTFRARRMDSCIDFDWTNDGSDHTPDGDVDIFDRGLTYNAYVPVSCCDVSQDYILVQLEVTDLHGNVNYCMVEVQVQDKQSPIISCPPDIEVSCKFWFDPNILENLSDRTFGTVVDGFTYPESARLPIIIDDPNNPNYSQPHFWGLDGYVKDNCNLEMEIRVSILDDCSGDALPGNAPPGAVKLIQRRFIATDPSGRVGTCTQNIWVVNFDPFYINSENPNDPTDDVIWPADAEYDNCGIPDTIYPTILNDGCSQIGINLKERRFDKTDGACVKILRDWTIIDWCQYNTQAGTGIWRYTQVVKITDSAGALFTDCNDSIKVYCTTDKEVTPVTNPGFQTSCFVHLNITKHIEDICSDEIRYEVKIYPPNSSNYIQAVGNTITVMNPDGTFDIPMNTALSPNLTLRLYGLEYNNPLFPQEHYKVEWYVWDGCGNLRTCVDKIRLEDCKQPSPVCINGLSTVPMPSNGTVTIWAKDFNASSFDNCTPENQLRYSFSGDTYQPSRIFTCADILALGVEMPIDIWVLDNWNNKDYCSTTIVFTDPTGVCGLPSGGISGIISTPDEDETVSKVGVTLKKQGTLFGSYTTVNDGAFTFPIVPAGQQYTLGAFRNDEPRNGVSTADLIQLQKHLLGSAQLNDAYLMIGADANNNGAVTAMDLVEIRKLILGQFENYPNNTSWRFIPESYVFPDPFHPWPFSEEVSFVVDQGGVVENFMGVKVGDLNRSASAHLQGIHPRTEATTSLSALDRFVGAGEEFEVTLSLNDFNEKVLGGQWTLKMTGAKVIGVISNDPSMTDEMWFASESEVRWAWNTQQAQTIKSLVTVKLMAIQAGKISEMVAIDPSFLEPELYDEDQEVYQLSLKWRTESAAQPAGDIQLHQNKPNPWIDDTVIPFEIPEAGEVTFTITNAVGEEVKSITKEFAAGKQHLKISNENWAPGAYYYTIRFGDTQLTKTMLILNKR